MAKKFKVFSEIVLGAASAITLSFAAAISPAHACVGADGKPIEDADGNVANCVETVSEEEQVLISPAPSAEEDIYADADSKVDSERSVAHSFFLAGNDVLSKDYVDGIHFLAGNLVEFTGSAEYGAFAGNSLKVNGDIDKDLFIAGNSIEIGEDTLIGRDLYAAATTVLIKANLSGNAFVGGQRVVLENVTLAGDLNLSADEIVIKGKVSVAGTLKYNDNARITGLENLTADQTETYVGSSTKVDVSFATSLTTKLIFLLGRLLVAIILIAIASKFSKRLLDEFTLKNSWKDLALGLGLLLALPLAIIFVAITVIGLPLGLVGLGFYIFFAYLSTSVTGLVLGDLLAKHLFKNEKLHVFLKASIGIVLLALLGLIPYIGSLITGLSTCFGFGYLVHKIFRQPKAAK